MCVKVVYLQLTGPQSELYRICVFMHSHKVGCADISYLFSQTHAVTYSDSCLQIWQRKLRCCQNIRHLVKTCQAFLCYD